MVANLLITLIEEDAPAAHELAKVWLKITLWLKTLTFVHLGNHDYGWQKGSVQHYFAVLSTVQGIPSIIYCFIYNSNYNLRLMAFNNFLFLFSLLNELI